jgi:hypothetical protein
MHLIMYKISLFNQNSKNCIFYKKHHKNLVLNNLRENNDSKNKKIIQY